ncbi:MAG: integrase core domain-containing protein, partial [Pseudomonadota bacterium]
NWRREFNAVRPHSSLGYRPPAPETFQPADTAGAGWKLQPDRPSVAARLAVT